MTGTTRQGELIQGFVNSILSMQGAAGIFVTASDREEAIGTEIAVQTGALRALPQQTDYNEEQLRNLIDVSLAIRDAAWFGELSAALSALRSPADRQLPAGEVPVAWRDRLGLIAQE